MEFYKVFFPIRVATSAERYCNEELFWWPQPSILMSPNLQAVVRRSHPAQYGEDRFGPPTLERSGSEHRRAVTSLALLERARAWVWVKDPLFARGGQGSRKML